jgi:hypothetical protein
VLALVKLTHFAHLITQDLQRVMSVRSQVITSHEVGRVSCLVVLCPKTMRRESRCSLYHIMHFCALSPHKLNYSITDFITKVLLISLQTQLLSSLQKCYWFHYKLNYWLHYKSVTNFKLNYWLHYKSVTNFITNSITDFITKVLLISLQTQLLTSLQTQLLTSLQKCY